MKSKSFLTLHKQQHNYHAQINSSKDIIVIVHVASVVQL